MVIGSAMMTNVRRIQRYLEAKIKKENEQYCSQEQASVSLFVFLNTIFRRFVAKITINRVGFGYF
jgi:hypothetical protein